MFAHGREKLYQGQLLSNSTVMLKMEERESLEQELENLEKEAAEVNKEDDLLQLEILPIRIELLELKSQRVKGAELWAMWNKMDELTETRNKLLKKRIELINKKTELRKKKIAVEDKLRELRKANRKHLESQRQGQAPLVAQAATSLYLHREMGALRTPLTSLDDLDDLDDAAPAADGAPKKLDLDVEPSI